MKEVVTVYPRSPEEWRAWLEDNHQKAASVWVIFHRKNSGKPSLTWSEAVDEALCFGWIDSKKVKIDDTSSQQYFCPRKPDSTWSKINKDKVERLNAEGKMAKAGMDAVMLAQRNGSWELLDAVEALQVPDDFAQALDRSVAAKRYFEALSKSKKKMLLHWIVMAKREETRSNRVEIIVSHAAEGSLPKGFR